MQINRLLKICAVYLIIATTHKTCTGDLWSKVKDAIIANMPSVGYYLMDDTQKKIYSYTQFQKKRSSQTKNTVQDDLFTGMLADFDPTGFKGSDLEEETPKLRNLEKEIAIRKVALKDLQDPDRPWEGARQVDEKNILEPLGADYEDVMAYKQSLHRYFESPYYKSHKPGYRSHKPDMIANVKRNIEKREALRSELQKKLRTYRAIEY